MSGSPLAGRMVFLVGVRRSGTKWLERLLSSHPEVVAIPSETHLFSDGIRHLQERVQHGLASSPATGSVFLERESFLGHCRAFCDSVFGGIASRLDPSACLIVERTPMHVFHLPLIHAVYPDARIIHIIRDGRDVARSLVAQSWGPASLAEAADEWREGIHAARSAELDGRTYREVRYEELLADPYAATAGLWTFLGLDGEQAGKGAALAEASRVVNEDPLNPGPSLDKWRETWTRRDLAVFELHAGDLLRDLAYARGTVESRRLTEQRILSGVRSLPVLRLHSRQNGSRRSSGNATLDAAAFRVGRFLDLLARDDPSGAASLLAPGAQIEVVAGATSFSGRDAAARSMLIAFLQDDPIGWDKVVSDHRTEAGRTTTVFVRHRGPTGDVERALIFTVGTEGITTLHYRCYELPACSPVIGWNPPARPSAALSN